MSDNGIGERIKQRRLELGMSQDELAMKLGFSSRSSICKIESNARNLTQQKIKAIADALETTPDYIMGWTNSSKSELENIIKSLDDSLSERLLIYAQALLDAQKTKKKED